MQTPCPLIILAGGFGTRLREVVSEVPKPIAPVNDKVFLYYVIMQAFDEGLRHIVLSLYYDSDKVIECIQSFNFPEGLKIDFVTEPEPMGTGGAIKYAYKKLGLTHGTLICNGDTYFKNAFQPLANSKTEVALALAVTDNTSRYGTVELNSENYIESFREKDPESKKSGHISLGVYWFSHQFVNELPEGSHSIEKDVFEKLAGQNKLKGIEVDTSFIDIGIPEDYSKFKELMAQ